MLPLVIFALTLFCILRRPFGFGIWVYSSIGAVATFALGLVELRDLGFIFSLIWDSALTLIALIVISFCLQAFGFFEWLIFWVLKICAVKNAKSSTDSTPQSHESALDSRLDSYLAINTRKAFILLILCCALTSAVLANDGAILIFTPLVLGVFLRARNATNPQIIAFLFATAFMCDISSNALIISNLTNIITANFYHIGFGDFARTMLLPNAFATLGATLLFLAVFRTSLSVPLLFRTPLKPKLSNKLFALHCACICVFVASFFLSTHFSLPLSVNCGIYAGILLFILWRKSHSKAKSTLKNAPFGIIIFVFGLFVVVFGLTKTNIQPFFVAILHAISPDKWSAIFGASALSAFGASVFNNLPMVLFGNLMIDELFEHLVFLRHLPQDDVFMFDFANSNFFVDKNLKRNLVYAHLLGCNIGSKLTPIGSLCTLLWLSLLAKNSLLSQKGINFGFWRYCKYALIFTPFVLCCACAGLLVAH